MYFEETNLYKTNDHFFYEVGQDLSSLTEKVPDLGGVFYILKLAKGRVDLVSLGKSNTLLDSKKKKVNSLKQGILYFPNGEEREPFLLEKMKKEQVDAIDIYWYVTLDKKNDHLPEYVLGLLMQRYYENFGKLPIWDEG